MIPGNREISAPHNHRTTLLYRWHSKKLQMKWFFLIRLGEYQHQIAQVSGWIQSQSSKICLLKVDTLACPVQDTGATAMHLAASAGAVEVLVSRGSGIRRIWSLVNETCAWFEDLLKYHILKYFHVHPFASFAIHEIKRHPSESQKWSDSNDFSTPLCLDAAHPLVTCTILLSKGLIG